MVALTAFIDLVSMLDQNQKYFDAIVPSRLLLFFGTATYACLGSNYLLCNNAVFVYCFVEVLINVLMFSALKEEKYNREREAQKGTQDEQLVQEFMYGEGGEDEADPEYERVVDDIRERVKNL